jgi:enamine deaminase RidA (YjgF/YER057c/UK114 family)
MNREDIKANGTIFVAGQIGIDPATGKLGSNDIAEQARQAIENYRAKAKTADRSWAEHGAQETVTEARRYYHHAQARPDVPQRQ